jgi:hypothetical protein
MDIKSVMNKIERYGALVRGGYEEDATRIFTEIAYSIDLLITDGAEDAVSKHLAVQSITDKRGQHQ